MRTLQDLTGCSWATNECAEELMGITNKRASRRLYLSPSCVPSSFSPRKRCDGDVNPSPGMTSLLTSVVTHVHGQALQPWNGVCMGTIQDIILRATTSFGHFGPTMIPRAPWVGASRMQGGWLWGIRGAG